MPASRDRPWTKRQIEALERGMREHPPSMDKSERWRRIARGVRGKTRRQCLARVKEIRSRLLANPDPVEPLVLEATATDDPSPPRPPPRRRRRRPAQPIDFDPLLLEGAHRLNLASGRQRRIARLLFATAAYEPGLGVHCMAYEGRAVPFTAFWFHHLPTRGALEFTFASDVAKNRHHDHYMRHRARMAAVFRVPMAPPGAGARRVLAMLAHAADPKSPLAEERVEALEAEPCGWLRPDAELPPDLFPGETSSSVYDSDEYGSRSDSVEPADGSSGGGGSGGDSDGPRPFEDKAAAWNESFEMSSSDESSETDTEAGGVDAIVAAARLAALTG